MLALLDVCGGESASRPTYKQDRVGKRPCKILRKPNDYTSPERVEDHMIDAASSREGRDVQDRRDGPDGTGFIIPKYAVPSLKHDSNNPMRDRTIDRTRTSLPVTVS
jgi:hypothetical protein